MANITRLDPLEDLFRGFFVRPVDLNTNTQQPPSIKMDVKEHGGDYFVHAELPGVKKEDIHVVVDGMGCFEEPENGVHPGRLPFIADTLRGISERGMDGGRRAQVLVNSHSPYLVDLLDPAEILLASLTERG